MDAKLMLVLSFTTIVVVAGYPSDSYTDIGAHLSPAKAQTTTCGDCLYLRVTSQVCFCLKYCFSDSNSSDNCLSGLREELKECAHPGTNCLTFTVQKGLSEVGKFKVCTLIDGTHCYYDPSPPVCELGYKYEAVQNSVYMEQEDMCICVEAKGQKICSPRGCDRLVETEEEGNGCICLDDGKGNKVCSPQGCDGSLVDMEEQDNGCFCLQDGKEHKVCSPQGCDDAPLTKEVADELRNQVELQRNKGGQEEVQATTSSISHELLQGDLVALGFGDMSYWLSCRRSTCDADDCPGFSFERSDFDRCLGEVFRMYHAAGHGYILSGDFVGLYYLHERKWFSMYTGSPRKTSCPGDPIYTSGFEDFQKWFTCPGEVFQVYAIGKPLGAKINNYDPIVLYYPAGIKYVVFKGTGVTLSRCMLEKSGFSRPPNNEHSYNTMCEDGNYIRVNLRVKYYD